jgi:hypothetical protein
MEPEAFLNSLTPIYEYIYNNESELEPLQYPLIFSRYRIPKFANQLYTDSPTDYFTYSGAGNSIIVTKEKEGRYKNLTLKAYSGDSFKFYFQTGSGIVDNTYYYSGPVTTSGIYQTLSKYSTQSGALTNAVTFTAPEGNSVVYVLPEIMNSSWVRLYHESVDGETPYRIYQFLPRTFIQVDDLEADVIDAVTVRVSGSIVVTADNLAAGSITGEKIMAGTVSGVLITPGTVTANEIAGGTITANKLNVDKLSAITSNMGQLYVTEKLEVTSGYLTAGIARVDSTGIKIGDANLSLPAAEALRIYGSGTVGNIVGMAFYNGSYSATNPQATIQVDATNALEIENNATNGLVNINFPAVTDISSSVNIYNADLNMKRSPASPADKAAGTIYGYDSDDTLRYKLGPTQFLLNNNTTNTFTIDASTGNTVVSGTLSVNDTSNFYGNSGFGTGGSLVTIDGASGNTDISGGLTVSGEISSGENVNVGGSLTSQYMLRANTELYTGYNSGTGLYRFNVASNGDITTVGAIAAGTSNNKFTVASATGNTAVAGTLDVVGKVTNDNMGYATIRRTTTQSITTAGTTIVWNAYTRNNNITYSTDTITIANAGYYAFSATFATADNLTSLRMTLSRGTINYVSTLHGAGLSTGGGYMFNFNVMFWAGANTTYKVILTPSSNTTLNTNNEGFAGPSPIINIVQLIGV